GIELVGREIGHQRVAEMIDHYAWCIEDMRTGCTGRVHDGHGVAGWLAEGHAARVCDDGAAGAERFLRIAIAPAGAGTEYRVRTVVASIRAEGVAVSIAAMRSGCAVGELIPSAGSSAEHCLLLGTILVAMVEVERQVGRVRTAAERQAGIHEHLVVVTAELGTAAADRNAVRQSPEPIVVAHLELGVAPALVPVVIDGGIGVQRT